EIADDSIQGMCAHVVGSIAGRTHQVNDPGAGAFGNFIELVLEYEILFPRGAIDQSDVLAWQVDDLEQRTHRGDPDTPGDQQHARPPTTPPGEDTVRAFREDQCAGGYLKEPPSPVAVGLDGDPQAVTGGGCGGGEWVGRTPRPAGENPPAEELARLRPQLVQVPTRHEHADHVSGFLPYILDSQPVPPELESRLQHSPSQNQREGVAVQQRPSDLQPAAANEVRPRELMSEPETDCQIGEQMQQVPALVGDASSYHSQG